MRKALLVIAILLTALVCWVAYVVVRTQQHIPEAYAAWDTGTLLIEYMKQHDDRWPKSWDELISVINTETGREIPLRGAQAGDLAYARSLREKISVDWTFEPDHIQKAKPVSPIGGGTFSIMWEGADPNEMISAYLANRASTLPSAR